ncbi:hypothetical protein LJR220_003340 [Bradyrhizobium sp. LjRoot220]|uniref:hypothetical protein n=1 Tax=Bradyrhizobium sp. LjRoot220 TaxID=3342284 RepID=UPI003ECE4CC7
MAAFRGGEKLAIALAEMAANLSRPGTLRVGFLEGATAPNGDSIPLRAALNEFGTGTIPPRPFFRNMVAEKSDEWPEGIAEALKANDYDATAALSLAGEGIKGQLQQSIKDTNSPPLAASTVKRKGFDKPLIEHGDMLNAVDYEVKS